MDRPLITNRFALSRPLVRAAFCAFLSLLPLATAWNLFVSSRYPSLEIRIGPKLGGVTYDTPVTLSWSSVRDGTFQKALASRLTDAMPIRPLLIRLNNEIRFHLFGELTAPNVVRGAKGQLVEISLLDELSLRSADRAQRRQGSEGTTHREDLSRRLLLAHGRHGRQTGGGRPAEAEGHSELLRETRERFCLCGHAVKGRPPA